MQYSVVNLQSVNNAINKRIDAEYWHPGAIIAEKRIKSSPLSLVIKEGYRVVYENTKIIDKVIRERHNLFLFTQASNIQGKVIC